MAIIAYAAVALFIGRRPAGYFAAVIVGMSALSRQAHYFTIRTNLFIYGFRPYGTW
jgi:hypothetical protein